MDQIFRRILFLLVAFALIGGTTSEVAHSAQYDAGMVMTGMPCDMMAMPAAASGDTKPMAPCKGMTPDCIKQMGCTTVTALPVPFLTQETTVRYSAIDYWTPASKLAGLVREPEPLPPRTA